LATEAGPGPNVRELQLELEGSLCSDLEGWPSDWSLVGAAKFGLPDCGTFVPSQILLISGQRGCIEALLISFEDYYTAFL
jgi:hypothetical protein